MQFDFCLEHIGKCGPPREVDNGWHSDEATLTPRGSERAADRTAR
jgi:hypothetical protein